MDRDESMRRRYGRRPGNEERWFDEEERRSSPSEADYGRFGEREYGQGDPWARARARRSDVRSWPQERTGMGGLQQYWSPSQWGSGVNMGQNSSDTGYDWGYPRDREEYEGGDDVPRPRSGPSYPERAWSHDYGHGGFTGRGPRGYMRTDDRIHEDVCERLTRHPYIDASEIVVEVKEGEVTLTGEVHERRAKHLAEDVVDAVSGVKDVHNKIKVQRSDWGKTMGSEIKREPDPEEKSRRGRG